MRESTTFIASSDPLPASVLQCLRAPELRRPLLIVSLAMLVQQVSGQFKSRISILFYSPGS